jgi:predicted ester cyclase
MNNKELVKAYYEKLWNDQDKSYIDKILDDDISFHGSLNISTHGKKEFESYMDMILGGIPNLYHGIEVMVAEGNNVVVRALYNGIHAGKLFDYEATNNRIRYDGASFFTIKDGKIKTIWVLGDLKSLYSQLTTSEE